MNMMCRGQVEISRNLSKQPFPIDSGRITLKNSLRDNVHLLKFPDFRLLVLRCVGSYSRVFTVFHDSCLFRLESIFALIKGYNFLFNTTLRGIIACKSYS